MFTQAEYELLRKRSPTELAQFLSVTALTPPASWEDAAQVKQLDADAARCVAQKLHGKSLLDGCYTLLEDAGLSFDFSETTQTILERIAEHRAEVRAGMTKTRPTPTAGEGRTAPGPRAALPRSEGGGDVPVRYLGTGLIVADLVYLFVTAKASPVIVALLAVAGVFMVAKGGRSAGASQQPPPTSHIPPSVPHAAAVPAKFSEAEADDVLHTLDILRRLHQSF